MTISSGTIKHKATDATTTHRFIANITGSFTMTGGLIDANALGYTSTYSYGNDGVPTNVTSNASSSNSGGSHGGLGTGAAPGIVYDDYRNPVWPGGGYGGAGGGVIKITAGGMCTLSPTPNTGDRIRADGSTGGAGGSINMNCLGFDGTISGLAIHANGSANGATYGGAGGRIAMVSTGNSANWQNVFLFPNETNPVANFHAMIKANGAVAGAAVGGAGTIYLKHSGLAYGALLIDNNSQTGTVAQTQLLITNANANVLDSKVDGGTVKVTASGTPFSNRNNLFKGMSMDIWPTVGGVENPFDISHTLIALTGNDSNNFFDTTFGFNSLPIGSNDYKYRIRHHLDFLIISGKSNVGLADGNLVIEKCDISNAISTAFAVPTGSSLSGYNIGSPQCSAAATTGAVTFTGNYMQP
jgi:hypothetical protein